MKKLLAVLMCALMLAACLSLGAYANEETTAADETTAAEEATTEEGATVERTADRVVFNADLASRPNCIVGMSGLAKGSGRSKKGEWEGVKVDIKEPEDPNFTFDYKSYCNKYDLTPMNGEDVGYIVLKVLVPEDGFYDDIEIFYGSGDITGATAGYSVTSEYCGEGNGFVYFIYNLDGLWEGAVNMFRIDPVGMDEGELLYIMELAMFKTEDDAITWCDFDEEETEEPTTEAPTTEAPTTEAPTTEAGTRPPREEKDEGCGGIVSVGAVVAMIALGAVCIKKKD